MPERALAEEDPQVRVPQLIWHVVGFQSHSYQQPPGKSGQVGATHVHVLDCDCWLEPPDAAEEEMPVMVGVEDELPLTAG